MKSSTPYLLALDAGTSAIKAVLFDLSGHQVASQAVEYQLEYPHPDWVEIDPEIYWQAAQKAIHSVIVKSKINPREILAMGVTSQGETLIVLDSERKPLGKAIVWLDNRARHEAQLIAENFDLHEVYRVTGQPEIVAGWTAAKILWLRLHEPEIFASADKFLMVQDYLVHKLTGCLVTDHGLNPSTLYYDLTTGQWWQSMLDFLEIKSHQLPDLIFSGQPVGRVRPIAGLGAETIVVTAPLDQVAGAVGAGNLAPGIITETTGSAMAICATCKEPHYDQELRLGIYRHALPSLYVMMPWVPTAGILFRWFRDQLGSGATFEELENEARAIAPGASGLTVLPHFSSAFEAGVTPSSRGVFHGVSLAHTRAHFVRALFEAVAYMLHEQINILRALKVEARQICSLGGGARSHLWLQIKADILNLPVVTVDSDEAAGLGVAMLAAVGAGCYDSLPEAVTGMVRYRRQFSANPPVVELYREGFKHYQALHNLLSRNLDKMQ